MTCRRSAGQQRPDRRGGLRAPHCTDRQEGASTIELVLLSPIVFLMTFIPIQAGLVLQARHVATAAAQEGARASRVTDLTEAQAQSAGRDRADGFAATLGGKALRDTTVTVDRGTEQVTVTVRGKALSILPGFTLNVTGTSVSPVERFEGAP